MWWVDLLRWLEQTERMWSAQLAAFKAAQERLAQQSGRVGASARGLAVGAGSAAAETISRTRAS